MNKRGMNLVESAQEIVRRGEADGGGQVQQAGGYWS